MSNFLARGGCAVAFVAACLLFGIFVALPSVPRWAVLYVFAAAISGWWALEVSRNGLRINRVGLASILFVGWSALSLMWSPDYQQGIEQTVRLIVIGGIATFVSTLPRRELERLLPHFIAASLLGALLFDWKWPTLHGGFGNPNFLAEFVFFCLPFAAWKLGEHTLRWDFLRGVAFVWGLYHLLFDTSSNLKYLAVGLWLILLAYQFRRHWFVALMILLVPVNVALLSGRVNFLPCSAEGADIMCSLQARLEVFYNSAALWSNFPWLGVGLGGFNFWYPLFQEAHVAVLPEYTVMMPIAQFAGAAHNEILQVLTETGIVGLAVAVLSLVIVLRGVKYDDFNKAALWTLIFAGVNSMIAFPLHTPPTALIAACALGVLGNGRGAVLRLSLPRLRWVGAPLATAFSIWVIVLGVLSYRAEMMFSVTQANISSDPLMAFWTNAEAAQTYPYHSHYRHQLVLSLRAVTDLRQQIIVEPEAADKAYEVSKSTSPFNPGIAAARVGYLINSGRFDEKKAEIEALLTHLKSRANLQAVTWLVETIYAMKTGDTDRAKAALAVGYVRSKRREYEFINEFQRLAGILAKE